MRTLTVLIIAVALMSSVLPPALAMAPDVASTDVKFDRFEAMSAGFDQGWMEYFNQGQFQPTATGSRAITTPPAAVQAQIAKMIDNVSAEYLEDYLTTLVGFKSRFYRSPHMLNNATPWLHDVLEDQGRLENSYHNFTEDRGQWGFITMSNVIYTLPGVNQSSDMVYYMYAHSDSIRHFDIDYGSPDWNERLLNNSPGADDDGSGCVAILEAARVLSRYQFQDTIKFLMVQAEEIGLIGSARYVTKISNEGENVAGGIDYDMVGYGSGNGQYDFDLIWNPASAPQGQHMVDINDRYDIGLRLLTSQTTGTIPSDITRFWQAGFPSVYGMEEEFTPYYHTANDTVDTVNFTQLRRATQLAVGTLAELARLIYVDVGVEDSDLSVSNVKPASDEEVTVEVNITNVGNINATNMKVQFHADGIPFDSKRIWVPANGTNTTNATWTAVEGNHRLSVELDPENEIVETDETNNTAEIYVYVNDRPRAVLTANPMIAYTDEEIEFNGSFSSDDVGGIVGFNFSFGDGNSTGWVGEPMATHAYPQDGIYTATLRVKDSEGAESFPVEVIVKVLNRAPMADPSSNVTRALTFEPIQFWANASDLDGVVMTHWDLGDGTLSDEVDPVHNYSKSGTYDILLDIEDDDGAKASYPLRVIIDNRDPMCHIVANNLTGDIETDLHFESNFSDPDGEIVAFRWDLGDGAFADTEVVYHVYSRPGTYTVRLSVWDDDGAEAKASVDIEITDSPPTAIADALTFEGLTFRQIAFFGHDSYDLEGSMTYSWDFGDGNTSTKVDPFHAYFRPGEYTVILTVMDSSGQNGTDTLPPIMVRNRPPKADFSAFGNFTENGTVYFDATGSTDAEGGLTYQWDFGDGSTDEGVVLGHVFPKAGSYTVNLTVKDESGDTNTVSKAVKVEPPPPPPPPPKKPRPADEQGSLLENQLFPFVLILLIALIIVLIWGATRKPKPQEVHQEPPQDMGLEEGPPGEDGPSGAPTTEGLAPEYAPGHEPGLGSQASPEQVPPEAPPGPPEGTPETEAPNSDPRDDLLKG